MSTEEAEKDLYFKRLNECSFHTRSVTDQIDRVVKLSDAVILYALIKQSEVDNFKSALREEIQKMQNECTDNGEYVVLEQLKEKLDSLTPKK